VKKFDITEKENLNAGHRQRMQKRFYEVGFEGFAPHEIIEFILFYSIPRVDTNKIAHRLIDRYGSVKGVLDADVEELKRFGLGSSTAELFSLLKELMYICKNEGNSADACNSKEKICQHFSRFFKGNSAGDDFIAAAFLDASQRPLVTEYVPLSVKTKSGGLEPNIREIAELAAKYSATGIVIVRKYEQNPMLYISENSLIARKLKYVLSMMDTSVEDYLLYDGKQFYSLKQDLPGGYF